METLNQAEGEAFKKGQMFKIETFLIPVIAPLRILIRWWFELAMSGY